MATTQDRDPDQRLIDKPLVKFLHCYLKGVWATLASSGLGVPGRRHGLGVITGAFRFLGWVDLQTQTLIALSKFGPTSVAEELSLQHLERPVFLVRPKNTQTDGARNQVRQLQTDGIALLVGEHDFEGQASR